MPSFECHFKYEVRNRDAKSTSFKHSDSSLKTSNPKPENWLRFDSGLIRVIPFLKEQYHRAICFISLFTVSKRVMRRCSTRSSWRRMKPSVVIADSFECARHDGLWNYCHSHATIVSALKLSPIPFIRRNYINKWHLTSSAHSHSPFFLSFNVFGGCITARPKSSSVVGC